jgi:hypothetical protein
MNLTARIAALQAKIVLVEGGAGPPPPIVPGSEVALAVPFTFASGTMVLGAALAGSLFTCAHVEFSTPFDDPTARVFFGTSGDPGLLLAANDSNPMSFGQFCSDEHVRLDVNDLLLLVVQPGSSTQGAGSIFYRMLPP